MVATTINNNMPSLKRESESDLEAAITRKKPRGLDPEPTSNKNKSSNKPGVRFASSCSVHEVPSRACLTEDDFCRLYLTENDQRKIYLDIARTLRDLKGNDSYSEREKEDMLRGLEGVMEREDNEPSNAERMKTAISAILDRQMLYEIDESWLSSYYRPYSEAAAMLARERAQRDEQENRALHPKNIVMQR
jgi:hypothetical protein